MEPAKRQQDCISQFLIECDPRLYDKFEFTDRLLFSCVGWGDLGKVAATMDSVEVMCPTCGEWFEVVPPPQGELPCVVDYDCEVCCRPMVIGFSDLGARAFGVGE